MAIIKDSDGTIRDANWPPADSVMLNDIRDQKLEDAKDAYQAFKDANGGLKSHSVVDVLFDGRVRKINNSTNEIEIFNADGSPYVAPTPEPASPSF